MNTIIQQTLWKQAARTAVVRAGSGRRGRPALMGVLAVLALSGLFAACSAPYSPSASASAAAGTATLSVSLGSAGGATAATSGARTILPAIADLSALIDSWELTLTSQNGFATRSLAGSSAGATVTVAGLEYGTWDISVRGLKAGVLAMTGSLPNQLIPSAARANLTVVMQPLQTAAGKGGINLAIQFPKASADAVEAWLETGTGTRVAGSTQVPALNAATADPRTGSYVLGDVASGSYWLVLSFSLGGQGAGIFREAVNIFDGKTSDKWLDSSGSLAGTRVYAASDFFDSSMALGNLVISPVPAAWAFAPATTSYDIGTVPQGSVSFTPSAGAAGQALSYRWNGASPVGAVSGQAVGPLALAAGTNTLQVIVTAPNRSSSRTYVITMYQAASTYVGPGGIAMVRVDGGTFQRDGTAGNKSIVGTFLIGMYEVTRAQFTAVTGLPDPSDTGIVTGTDDPVQKVTWYQTLIFCNKLSRLEGLTPVYALAGSTDTDTWGTPSAAWDAVTVNQAANGYRLPTRAEWLWAAMGGNADSKTGDVAGGLNTGGYTKRFAGDDGTDYATTADYLAVFSQYVWHYQNSPSKTQPVGTKRPNELGIHDLSGSLNEWSWDGSPAAAGTTVNFQSPSGITQRYIMGLGWLSSNKPDPPDNIVWPFLFNTGSTFSLSGLNTIGFRVARSVTRTVTYLAGSATVGSVPAAPAAYPDRTVLIVPGNTGRLIGPAIQDGISQRLTGWSTGPNGTGTVYAAGSACTLAGADLVLYPVWTTDASVIGKIGPAGGWIFYDKGVSDTAPSGSTPAWRYMELSPVSPQTQSGGSFDFNGGAMVASSSETCFSAGSQANSTVVGYGAELTKFYATTLFTNYIYGGTPRVFVGQVFDFYSLSYKGFGGWFLPDHDEMNLIYTNLYLRDLGSLYPDRYWTSTWGVCTADKKEFMYFPTGTFSFQWNSNGGWYRAARRF